MKRSCYFQIVFLFLVIFSLASPIFAKDEWLEMSSIHFRLIGNVSEPEIREVALKLEQFHKVFNRSFPQTQIKTPFQTNVIVFKDSLSLNIYRPQILSNNSNKYFFPADDANYAILSINNPEAWEQILTGYTKFLLENNMGRNNLPAWMFEGLVEFFQTFKVLNTQTAELGYSAKNVKVLPQTKLIPFEVLFENDHFTLQNQGEERKNLFRAESWALIQYLLKDENNFEKIERFLELRKQGSDSKKALIEVFQTSFAKISEEFPNFIQSNSFSPEKIKFEDKLLVDNDLHSSNISPAKAFGVLGDFLFYADRLQEAKDLIEKALTLEPNQSLALTTLSLIKAKEFYYEEAENLAQKAIENEPDNYLNQYRHALTLSQRGMTEYGFISGYSLALANLMREALKKSIDLNPTFTASDALLAFVNFIRNEQLDESIQFIQRALVLAPGNHQYQLRLAELNLRKEKFSEARKLAIQVFQNTPSEGVRLYAQNTIERIDSTEFQLERLRNEKTKYVSNDIVTDQPLSDEEIKRLREKATNEQIRAMLRRPKTDEKRVLGSLTKIECGKNKIDFFVATQNGLIKLQSTSLDGISLLSLVEELSDYRLGCSTLVRENNASIIFKSAKDSTKTGEIISIEFVPKGFKLVN